MVAVVSGTADIVVVVLAVVDAVEADVAVVGNVVTTSSSSPS
jgi:hypothetical protein